MFELLFLISGIQIKSFNIIYKGLVIVYLCSVHVSK